MACSRYEYVKKFEESHIALLQTYIVIRIDGRSFTKFCSSHQFEKPNDIRAINLMNVAAKFVLQTFQDIFLAYGQSDQYSFALKKNTKLFNRRTDKILSTIVSAFSSAYVFNWPKFFNIEMKTIPTFDSRVVLYPNQNCLKDYFRWRQVDCHINNLYNTTFWYLVKSGKSNTQVEKILKDTNSGQKNQILFSQFKINYNNLPQIEKKGSIYCYRTKTKTGVIQQIENKEELSIEKQTKSQKQTIIEQKIEQIKQEVTQTQIVSQKKQMKKKKKEENQQLLLIHEDLIKDQFWETIIQ